MASPERRTAAHWATVRRWWRGWEPSVAALPPPKSLPGQRTAPFRGPSTFSMVAGAVRASAHGKRRGARHSVEPRAAKEAPCPALALSWRPPTDPCRRGPFENSHTAGTPGAPHGRHCRLLCRLIPHLAMVSRRGDRPTWRWAVDVTAHDRYATRRHTFTVTVRQRTTRTAVRSRASRSPSTTPRVRERTHGGGKAEVRREQAAWRREHPAGQTCSLRVNRLKRLDPLWGKGSEVGRSGSGARFEHSVRSGTSTKGNSTCGEVPAIQRLAVAFPTNEVVKW